MSSTQAHLQRTAGARGHGTAAARPGDPQPEPTLLANEAQDDRDDIQPGDTVLLIVENDIAFARFLLDAVREHGCKGLVTSQGAAALALARDYMPDAITLDIVLPDMDGWRVMDRLKHDLSTRHIPDLRRLDRGCARAGLRRRRAQLHRQAHPVEGRARRGTAGSARQHEAAGQARSGGRARSAGALDAIEQAIAGRGSDRHRRRDSGDAAGSRGAQGVDCLIVDGRSRRAISRVVARALETGPRFGRLPVHRVGTPATSGAAHLGRSCDALTVRHVQSRERLVDLVAFFLHRRVTRLPEAQHRLLEDLHQSDAVLKGRKVLIVDDDIRNIFALDQRARGARHDGASRRATAATRCASWRNRRRHRHRADGHHDAGDGRLSPPCARRARSRHCRDLPIIAVTAKAMKGDRERCIEAGAWDYLSKPVDSHHLLAVLRSWLYR